MTTPESSGAKKAETSQPDTRKCVFSPRYYKTVKLTEHRCDYKSLFDSVVGRKRKQETFTVYNDLMIPRSEFFRAARSKCWLESDPTRPTSLKHEDPETFAAYLDAIYLNRIRVENFHLYESGDYEDSAACDEMFAIKFDGLAVDAHGCELMMLFRAGERFMGLIKLYILSNMLLDHQTANMVVDEMIHTHDLVEWTPLTESVGLLWSSTLAGDGMRNLICDLFVISLKLDGPGGLKANEDWPAEFLKDLVMALMRYEGNEEIKERDPSFTANYCANWEPSQGPHRYYSGPETGGEEPAESSNGAHRNKRQRLG
jgi:hypothetical protein